MTPNSTPEARVGLALSEGDVRKASSLLGHLYYVKGVVVPGHQLGRTLGFPTANLKLIDTESMIPAKGVYAVFTIIDSLTYRGVSNIGTRPTVDGKLSTFEVHLLQFNGNLYDKLVAVFFLDRIRDERRFNDIRELVCQIRKDIEVAESMFIHWNKTDSNSMNSLRF
jgi:riboflavin kinase/FMN adenylyltransferase